MVPPVFVLYILLTNFLYTISFCYAYDTSPILFILIGAFVSFIFFTVVIGRLLFESFEYIFLM